MVAAWQRGAQRRRVFARAESSAFRDNMICVRVPYMVFVFRIRVWFALAARAARGAGGRFADARCEAVSAARAEPEEYI